MEKLEEDKVMNILSSFRCEQDSDIETFLHNRAVEFENLAKARTYLIFSQEELEEGRTPLTIYGYISLALKILTVPDSVSNRMRKELDGFSAKLHGQQLRDFPCYLIGQLSKNSNAEPQMISGCELIETAYDIIASAVEAVGGRYIMIECRDKEKLIHFYQSNGFSEIDRIPDHDEPMVQMIRKI